MRGSRVFDRSSVSQFSPACTTTLVLTPEKLGEIVERGLRLVRAT